MAGVPVSVDFKECLDEALHDLPSYVEAFLQAHLTLDREAIKLAAAKMIRDSFKHLVDITPLDPNNVRAREFRLPPTQMRQVVRALLPQPRFWVNSQSLTETHYQRYKREANQRLAQLNVLEPLYAAQQAENVQLQEHIKQLQQQLQAMQQQVQEKEEENTKKHTRIVELELASQLQRTEISKLSARLDRYENSHDGATPAPRSPSRVITPNTRGLFSPDAPTVKQEQIEQVQEAVQETTQTQEQAEEEEEEEEEESQEIVKVKKEPQV